MVELKTFIRRFDNIDKFLVKTGQKLLIKLNDEVVDLQNKQLLRGVNVKNEIMQRGYSSQYGKKRRKRGLQTAFVDLKFTGKYQSTKKLFKKQEGVDIRSAADYEPHLRANFPDHVGLTVPNAEKIAQLLVKDLAVEIDKYLGK